MSYRLRLACRLGAAAMILLIICCFSMTIFATPDKTPPKVPETTTIAQETLNGTAHDAEPETMTTEPVVHEADENAGSDVETAPVHTKDSFIHTGDSGYALTEDERILVECAVMCEAGGESLEGQMMVAQSILDGSLRNDYTIAETIYQYTIATTSHAYVTDQVREAVSLVFDDGERITEHKTDLWYNPALTVSLWHEEQEYVITVGSHRFFWMNSDM